MTVMCEAFKFHKIEQAWLVLATLIIFYKAVSFVTQKLAKNKVQMNKT